MTLNKSITDQELFRYLFWGVCMLNLTRHHASWREGPYFLSTPVAERTMPQGCDDRVAELPGNLLLLRCPLWRRPTCPSGTRE